MPTDGDAYLKMFVYSVSLLKNMDLGVMLCAGVCSRVSHINWVVQCMYVYIPDTHSCGTFGHFLNLWFLRHVSSGCGN